MKLQTRFAAALLSVLLVATAASARITTDYDHNVNFGQYKTYSWAAVKTPDSLWDQRVKDAVNSELAARGWTLVPSGVEVSVTARDAIHNQQELNTFYDGFGGRRVRFPKERNTNASNRSLPFICGWKLAESARTSCARFCPSF